MYAKYIESTDKTVLSLLDGLSQKDREGDKGSYYKSLSGLARHIVWGSVYFHSLYRSALPKDSQAVKALEPTLNLKCPEGELSADAWKAFEKDAAVVDGATVRFAQALDVSLFDTPVSVPWYSGNPAHIPLYFLFIQSVMHAVHHQGQISQILDELKVEHDFTSIPVGFLPA
jgi:uncharacterized damage-inducible protein DinB